MIDQIWTWLSANSQEFALLFSSGLGAIAALLAIRLTLNTKENKRLLAGEIEKLKLLNSLRGDLTRR